MKIKRKPKAEAFLQILILVIGIIAISYAVGSSVGIVSAGECTLGKLQCENDVQRIVRDIEAITGDLDVKDGAMIVTIDVSLLRKDEL